MKIKISFVDKILDFSSNNVICLNILNRTYLIRIMKAFYNLSEGESDENIYCFNEQNEEENLVNKVNYISNYFDVIYSGRKFSNEIINYILKELPESDINNIQNNFKKYENELLQKLSKLDVPLQLTLNDDVDDILKIFKIEIFSKESMLDNLFLLLKIESIFKINKLICLINLKQYLTSEQINELLKYATYNNLRILLIESTVSKINTMYETNIIIDEELEEL